MVTVPRSPPISAEIMYRRVRAGWVCQPSGKETVPTQSDGGGTRPIGLCCCPRRPNHPSHASPGPIQALPCPGCLEEIVGMTKQALLSEILRLPPDERIELLGEAWDALAASPEDVALPEWHLEELERRLADPDPKYVPWEEVRARLQGSS